MRKARHWWSALVAAVVAGLVVATPTTAVAQPATVADDVAAMLRVNPGSYQVDATTIEIKPGVRMAVPSGTGRAVAASCPFEWLCLYQHGGYGGAMVRFWTCRNENLRDYRLPDGRDWRDKTSSFINNQTVGTVAWPKDTIAGSGNFFAFPTRAYQRVSDLVTLAHPNGGNWNEKVDAVLVC